MAFCGDEFISKFPLRMSFSGNTQISLKCWLFLGRPQSFAHEKLRGPGTCVETIDRVAMAISARTVN